VVVLSTQRVVRKTTTDPHGWFQRQRPGVVALVVITLDVQLW
jgi:hypothetical protein